MIIVAFEQEKYVAEAVQSALDQTYPNIRYIFSDDCSTDRTFEQMRQTADRHPRADQVLVRRTPRNHGLSGHINDVVDLIETDFVVLSAGDDVSEPTKVEKLLAPMLADPSVVATHSAVTEMTPSGQLLKRRDCRFGDKLNSLAFVIEHAASNVIQSHACRVDVYREFPPLDPQCTNEGIVMTAREAMLGRIVYVPEPLTRYRLGGISTKIETTEKQQISEAVKVTNWSLSALRQIRQDIDSSAFPVPSRLYKNLCRRISYFERLLRINKRPIAVFSLLSILIRGRGAVVALRAIVRRNLPTNVYGYLVSLGQASRLRRHRRPSER